MDDATSRIARLVPEENPNKPKRPPSPFFVFMEGFRKEFKEKHPQSKGVAALGKAGGDKWRSMSDAEKAPFVGIAEQKKKDYDSRFKIYENKQAGGNNNDEFYKSGSEVSDHESDKSESEVSDHESDKSESEVSDDESDKSESEVSDDEEEEEGSKGQTHCELHPTSKYRPSHLSEMDDATRRIPRLVPRVMDPNKPKRPPSPFFVFMEGFRKEFKEKHPESKGVAAMGKAGGDKWMIMSDAEKAPFVSIAEQKKKDYDSILKIYENKQEEDDDDGTN